MRHKRILITGSEGFVGRHFDTRLSRENRIDRIDKLLGTTAQLYFNCPMDFPTYDLVIHCAAMVGGRAKIDGDPLAIAENLAIDSDFFRWVIRTGQPRVVYFSSSAAYPTWLQTRQDDRRITRLHESDIHPRLRDVGVPDQTYGWAKLTGEILSQHAAASGTRVHVFRPFSGYGEDQDLDYPFPSFIDRARRKADPFEIWGDGTAIRDFIHVEDIVGAVLAAIDEDITDPVNLGWGRPTSFNELADLVTGTAGYNPEIRHLTDKPVGCHTRVSNNGFMQSFYTPKVSLEEGIQRALRG